MRWQRHSCNSLSHTHSVLWLSTRVLALLAAAAAAHQERNTLWEVCETPGLLALLPGILNKRPGEEQLQRLILEFRNTVSAATAAAAAASGFTTDAIGCQGVDAVFDANAAEGLEEVEGDDGGDDGGDDDDDTLEKAQAHVAWLLAALASDPRTRYVIMIERLRPLLGSCRLVLSLWVEMH